MSLVLKIILTVLATAGVATSGYVFYAAGLSPFDWVYQGGAPTNWTNGGVHGAPGGVHGAPGPVVGAGLPLLIAAYGAYRLFRRHRRGQ